MTKAASQVRMYLELAIGNENFTGQPQAVVLRCSPGKKRGCQRVRATNSGGGGRHAKSERGVTREKVVKCPSQSLSSRCASQEVQTRASSGPISPTPDSPTEELGPKPRRPRQAASGGAPADAILKAKMAAPRKPAPRS